jgi:predicted ATPase
MATKCPECHFENPEDTFYCGKCAHPLPSSKEISASRTKTIQTPIQGLTTGSLFAGRYQVLEELGRGGMGKVYKALDKEIQEEVALKLLNPEIAGDEKTIERFRNELKYARRITHRHVCRMHDINRENETYFITMEYVPGEDLKTVIKRTGQLPENEAVPIAGQVCEGLMEAHRLGVVHRDLKPQNIMILKDGQVRIMDFGIARSLAARGVTEAGLIIGTPDYMSPEQVEGREADARSDIYALGATLYEMVTGRVPFEGDTALIIAMKQKAETPLSPKEINPRISEELTAVILKCLEKDPEKRYQTAGELLAELSCLKEGLPTAAAALKPRIPAFLIEGAEEVRLKRPVFVACSQEIEKLGRALEAALSNKGRVMFVTGEAGSGKTALVQEFARRVQETYPELIVASGKCNAHAGIGDPYLPFIEILRLLTGDVEAKWTAGSMSRDHALRLWNLLPLAVKSLSDDGPDLINIFIPGAALAARSEAFSSRMTSWLAGLKKLVERKSSLPPDLMLQQSNLLEQYTLVLQDLSREKPLLLILDDLQWVDPGSASLLFHLGRRIQGCRILVIGAFRPAEVALGRGEERHPLEPILHELKRDFGEIEIEAGKTEARRFVDDLIDSEPNRLGHKFRETLYSQTKGHPLFTVELLRNMEESGALVRDKEGRWLEGPDLDWNTLPARVDAVIEERVQRLNQKLREILTVASVEGEEFTAEVVARIQKEEVRELIKLLSRELDKRHHLVTAKGIRQLEKQRLSSYLFQHILFQRYLYNSLDQVEKAELHEEVGSILEALYGEQAEEIAVQLARHFLEAGIVPKAIDYLHKAGNKAVRLSAGAEAIAHYNKALDLLSGLPETPERDQRELALQLALLVPLMSTKGFGSPESGRAVVRARELCDRAGDMQQRFFAFFQLVNYYGTTGQYRTALKFADQMSQIGEQSKDPVLRACCYYAYAWPLLNLGELVRTVEYGRRMIDVYDQEKHGFLAYLVGYDVGVFNQGFDSWAQWILGYPDTALRLLNESVNLARRLGHQHTLGFVLLLACELNWFLGNFPQISKDTEELVPFCEKNGFIYVGAHGYFYRGERAVLQGQVKEGIAQMRQSLAIMEATGTVTCFSRLRLRLADACRKAGDLEQALAAVNWALEAVEKYDERYVEAEIYRLKGELLRILGRREDEVEGYFRKAIEISRQRFAKSWELRATMSLSRLWQSQGKREEAKKALEEVYSWFTEGFTTPDLIEAKALLESFSQ